MAKKKTQQRRRGSPSGAEEQRKRQERHEDRRREREAAAEAQRRAAARARVFRITVIVAILLTVSLFLFRPRGGATEIQGHPIESFSTAGLQQHTEGTVDYDTSPPVSGTHAFQASDCGVHGEQIPNELQVHALEHGAVGIQYQPDLDPADIDAIEAVVGDYDSHVFSAPYEDMDPAIAVTSWSRMMALDSLDEGAVRDYVDMFRAQGPEDQDCPHAADQPFEPAGGGG